MRRNDDVSALTARNPALLTLLFGMAIIGDADRTANKTIGLVVVLAIIGGTIGSVFTNLGTIVAEFLNISTGSTVIDTIVSSALVLLVGFAVVFGIVRLIQNAAGSD